MQTSGAYALVDVGGGARLERFAERLVDRPHPAALESRRDPSRWLDADLRFDRDQGWTGPAVGAGPWPVALAGLSLELRPTDAGQVGLFPEHLAMIPWLGARLAERLPAAPEAQAASPVLAPAPAVLNLFAYTGLATLFAAGAGCSVTHVDSSRPAVAWAKRNATQSNLGDRPIRWIVDDAVAFASREARRGLQYAGVVLDPPTYGHGPGGRPWRLEDDLETLLQAAFAVLDPDGFILLTAHTPGFDGDRLADHLARAVGRPTSQVGRGALSVTAADGRGLELGAFARSPGGS